MFNSNEHRSVSLADQIFERLEKDILVGKFERGEILTEMKLSEMLGVSRTPIREAMRRLEQEHIVKATPKGSMVVGISPTDIESIYEMRLRIEGLAARYAAKNATEEELKALNDILELQSFYIDKNHQGKGYGKQSAKLAIAILKLASPEKQIKLATEASNVKAHSLYKSLGFEKLDEMDGDDFVFGL